MQMIISPAKKMQQRSDLLPLKTLPQFLDRASFLLQHLRGLSYAQLQSLWQCNEKIARENYALLQTMDLFHPDICALLAYQGIQYTYMAPQVFSREALSYAENHVRILSAFYGLLRPFDGVVAYRLEMQAKVQVGHNPNLYAFWNDRLARTLLREDDCIVNLASEEYSRCVSRYLPSSASLITCVFAQQHGTKLLQKGTLCKMARGEMVRFACENQIQNPMDLRAFDHLSYRFSPAHSSQNMFVFIQQS